MIDLKPQQQQITLSPEAWQAAKTLKCTGCSNGFFVKAVMAKYLSPIMSATGEPTIAFADAALICVKCGQPFDGAASIKNILDEVTPVEPAVVADSESLMGVISNDDPEDVEILTETNNESERK